MLESSTDWLISSDDETMERIITLYTEQLDDHYLFTNQFDRWKQNNLTSVELTEVERLIEQSSHLKTVNEAILKIAHSIEHGTIDKILAMSEIDLVEALVSGKIQPPG